MAAALLASCAVLPGPDLPSGATTLCRSTQPPAVPVRWLAPVRAADRARLDAWCAAVGPAVFRATERRVEQATAGPDDVLFASWNVHVGSGDVRRFVHDLEAGRFSQGHAPKHFVLMLQEAVRTSGVPAAMARGARSARLIGPRESPSADIDRLARDARLSILYVPSMRNGQGPSHDREPSDRGNAILSTLPLADPVAVELPGSRQRRVAIAARVLIQTADRTVPLVVSTAHLNVLGSARTLWVFRAASTRAEQARAFIQTLPDGAALAGIDVNSWQGRDEPALGLLRRAFPSTPPPPRSTFRAGLVLDQLFFRIPDGWRAAVLRVSERYGSDHYPVVGSTVVGR